MTADNENGNGELKQLLEIKRAYRKDLTSLEEDVRAKLERELADGKKRLKEQYLEKIVDAVFAEPAPSRPVAAAPVEVKTEPEPAPRGTVVIAHECPECGAPVNPGDTFCSRCAYPLKEDAKNETPVVSASRQLRTRRR
jgi:hypothetical protein